LSFYERWTYCIKLGVGHYVGVGPLTIFNRSTPIPCFIFIHPSACHLEFILNSVASFSKSEYQYSCWHQNPTPETFATQASTGARLRRHQKSHSLNVRVNVKNPVPPELYKRITIEADALDQSFMLLRPGEIRWLCGKGRVFLH